MAKEYGRSGLGGACSATAARSDRLTPVRPGDHDQFAALSSAPLRGEGTCYLLPTQGLARRGRAPVRFTPHIAHEIAQASSARPSTPSTPSQVCLELRAPPRSGSPNATPPSEDSRRAVFVEREKGFEPSTSTLARWHSTAELLPQIGVAYVPGRLGSVKRSGRRSEAGRGAGLGGLDGLGEVEVEAEGVDELHLARRLAGGLRQGVARNQDRERLGP